MNLIPLYGLTPGERGIVRLMDFHICTADQQAALRRLWDLGLIPQTQIVCIGQSPFGTPKSYLIRGAVMALRKEEASLIWVEKTTEKT